MGMGGQWRISRFQQSLGFCCVLLYVLLRGAWCNGLLGGRYKDKDGVGHSA